MPLTERARDLIQNAVDIAVEEGATDDEIRAEIEFAIESAHDG